MLRARSLCVVASLAVVLAAAPSRGAHTRSFLRTVLLPSGFTPGGSPSGTKSPSTAQHRCLYAAAPSLAQDGSAGIFGYVVDLPAAEADGNHRFMLWDQTQARVVYDFDVTFYVRLGNPCAVPSVAPQPNPPPTFSLTGNESGVIPAGMRYAVVTTTTLAGGTFSMRIEPR